MFEDKKTPVLANKGQTPYIPTGYEGLQSSVQRKRKIADALMAQGLQGPGPNARSWAQLLGSLAQTWAGKSIQKDADKEEASIQEKIKADVMSANQGFEADIASGLGPKELVQKWGGNQWLKERLDPYEKALQQGLENEQTFGDPIDMQDAQGNWVTGAANKAGGVRQVTGGLQLPPKLENVNGVAVALQRQKDGSILPQNLTDSVIRGPDGKPMVNQDALDAKVKVAAAGAANSKITVNTAEDYSKAAVDRLEATQAAADGGISALGTVKQIRSALRSGQVSTGPLSGVKNWAEKVFGLNEQGVAKRRAVEQGLNELVLASRGALKGQGAISDKETALLEKAAAGNIDDMTPGEIEIILDTAERLGKAAIQKHGRQVEAARGQTGSEMFLPAFELPDEYKPRRAPAARPAKRGLPPKGAARPAPKPAVKPSRYQSLLPPPAGGR